MIIEYEPAIVLFISSYWTAGIQAAAKPSQLHLKKTAIW
jgi:hypothetical protein